MPALASRGPDFALLYETRQGRARFEGKSFENAAVEKAGRRVRRARRISIDATTRKEFHPARSGPRLIGIYARGGT